MKKFFLFIIITVMLMGGIAGPVMSYPDKPVSFVVPWPPGELEDILTRLIADEFQSMYGVAAAVVNKPGGGGGPFPGALSVANAPADGATIGSFVVAVPVIGPMIDIPGLTDETFEPIGIFMTYPFVIAAKSSAPYSTMQELASYAKSNDVVLGHYGENLIPTKITNAAAKKLGFSFSSSGTFDMVGCNTIASGDADVITTTVNFVLPCIDKLKILATITSERIPIIPDVPTVAEIEPDLKLTLWNGLFVKKGTSQEVKDKVAAAAIAALKSQKVKKIAKDTGAEIFWMNAEDTKARIIDDRKIFIRINQLLK